MTYHDLDRKPVGIGERKGNLRVEHTEQQLRIFREGVPNPIITQHAMSGKRPFIHPILAPDGVGELTENEPGHHLWQHGLYVGLNDVSGVGFWKEGLSQKNRDHDGTFHPKPLEQPGIQGNSVGWMVNTEWRSPVGAPMLEEMQHWEFRDEQTRFVLTLSWTLWAVTDLRFGKYPYGGLFLRMPWQKGTGGRTLSSEGAINRAAEGKRARWMAINMPIPGRDRCLEKSCSIAILDHPQNPEHPVKWRVDGNLGVAPSRCIAGAWNLARGESTVSRYRLLIWCGDIHRGLVEEEWRSFSQLTGEHHE